MSKSHVSRGAAVTLSAVDTALRRSEDLHWSDPEFLAWEAGQVGELVVEADHPYSPDSITRYWAEPGPAHDRVYGHDLGVEDAPMVTLREDHPDYCLCDEGQVPPGRAMIVRAANYPPREHTTHGPLLLGPEPAAVLPPTCAVCEGGGLTDIGRECPTCDGTGRPPTHPEGQGVIQ